MYKNVLSVIYICYVGTLSRFVNVDLVLIDEVPVLVVLFLDITTDIGIDIDK
jgi:hypothetical protein